MTKPTVAVSNVVQGNNEFALDLYNHLLASCSWAGLRISRIPVDLERSPMNVSGHLIEFLAKVARESGHEQLWTALTAAVDEQIAATQEVGRLECRGLPPSDDGNATLAQLQAKAAACHEQLRAAAKNDLMALFLLNHSWAGQGEYADFDQQFDIAQGLRQIAERWITSDAQWSEVANEVADDLLLNLQFDLYLDPDTENALAQEVYNLGGVVIPTTWQGWPFPRLAVPLPLRRIESPAESEARSAAEDRGVKGWQRAVAHRLCTSNKPLSFWFPQVISMEELELPANRVNDAFPFPDLFTSEDWPVIQLQIESPPNAVKHPSILSLNTNYRAFRCHWNEEDFTPEATSDFFDRLMTLRGFFIQLHEWCQKTMVQLTPSTFCGPTPWKGSERFRHDWEQA